MPFRPTHLRYFVTVADEGQLTRAARKLGVAQPALSQAIAQLEAELGLQLLQRHARGVSLTSDGEAFLPKARVAVQSEREVELTADALTATARGAMTVGFVGPPPTITASELFGAFAAAHPQAQIVFADLSFPHGSTRSWIEPVDVAFCHRPSLDASVRSQVVRIEPRAVIAHTTHRLANRERLAVDAVLDETFIGYHDDVQAEWAAFHSLDDRRGGPPPSTTDARARTALEMLGIMSAGGAITTLPACDAALVESGIPDLVSIPLDDADPAVMSLVFAAGERPPLVAALSALAAELADVAPSLSIHPTAHPVTAARATER
jgi:LysR family hca operon transcriptional activator